MTGHEDEISHLIDRAIAVGADEYATNPLHALDVFRAAFPSNIPAVYSVALYRLCNLLRDIHAEIHTLLDSINTEDFGDVRHTVALERMFAWEEVNLLGESGHPVDQRNVEEWRCSIVEAGGQYASARRLREELENFLEREKEVMEVM